TPRKRATQEAMKRQPRTTPPVLVRRGPPHRKARLPDDTADAAAMHTFAHQKATVARPETQPVPYLELPETHAVCEIWMPIERA
ncbi:MAG: hypothetical protein SW127_05360, partial [Actinomycetota bacterium]|nr:hypothetical protein [Actinomycetota bacterium]